MDGNNSFAIGYLTQVKGIKSGAIGIENKIYGNSVNVFGSNNTVDKGTLETDTVENVLVLGNKNSASIDNKASASRDSGTPTVSGAIGIGNGVILGEENATAIGNGSKSTALNSFAAGQDAEAAAENTTAIGFGATSSKKNALAFGTGASASETDTVAVGSSASASETNAVAIGSFASATKENSVAIGAGSVADVANTVSVGKAKVMSGETVISPEVTRRIMHVTAGTDDTDAVNVKQLRDMALDKANVDASNVGKSIVLPEDSFAPGTTDDEKIALTRAARLNNQRAWGEALGGLLDDNDKTHISATDTCLVQGKDVHEYGTPGSNGNYIAVANTVGANLSALDNQIKINADTIDGHTADIANLKNLSNITEAGHTVIKDDAKSAINVVGGSYATVDKTEVSGVDTYTVNVATDGEVADGNTKLVTGGTVYNAMKDLTVSVDGKANVSLDNITADGHNVIKADAKSAINVKGNMDVKVTKTDVNGVDTYSLSVAKDGTVVGGDTKLVTGDTVYNAIQGVVSDMETALKGKANVNLDNINADGVNVVRMVAKNAVKVADGENTTVSSETDTDGNIIYKVKTNATGTITANNTGLLNGGTVYNEVRPASDGNYITVANTAGQNLTALDGKLKETYELVKEAATQGHDINVVHYDSLDKDTVTMKGKEGTKITNLKDGEVSKDSTDAVTGKQLHEVKQTTIENKQAIDGLTEKVGTTNDGSYVKSTNTVGQNLNTLDSQLKNNSDAISTVRETTNTQLETKTNTDMSNITETGKETIRELARGSVNVVSEDGTVTVTESNVDTVRTFDLSVVKDGKVESGNTGIVTGGTVYDAIQKSSMITLEDNTIRIGAKNNAEIIDITNSNGEGRVLHGIITDPNDNNSAANVGYVNAIGEAVINNVNGGFRRMDEKINKTGAHAAALASLAPASFDGGEKWALSAAVGNYHGETAAAIGAFYRPADNIMINLRSSLGSGNNMVGAGVSFALDKGFSTGISKKQLVNTINVQAEKLQQAEARIAEQDRRAAEQDKKIAELEAIVKELVKERKP